jgi:hypothetical protein
LSTPVTPFLSSVTDLVCLYMLQPIFFWHVPICHEVFQPKFRVTRRRVNSFNYFFVKWDYVHRRWKYLYKLLAVEFNTCINLAVCICLHACMYMQLCPANLCSNRTPRNIFFGFSFLDPIFIYLYNNNNNNNDDDDDPFHSLLHLSYMSVSVTYEN